MASRVPESDRLQAAWSRLVSARRAEPAQPLEAKLENCFELPAADIQAEAEALVLAAAIDCILATRLRRVAVLMEQHTAAPTLRALCDQLGIPFSDLGLPIWLPPGELPDLVLTARDLLAWLEAHPSKLPPAPGEAT